MKAWTYYQDRAGDYILVRNRAVARDIHDAAAPEERGKHRSVELTVVDERYLARCKKVERDDVPPQWRDALTGVI